MSRNRYAARTDDNEKEIVKALKKLGYGVLTGVNDILVGDKGINFLYEIKNPAEVDKNGDPYAKKSKTAKKQKKMKDKWEGHYLIVSSLEEILEDIKNA